MDWKYGKVAEKTPDRIKKISVDINVGCTDKIAGEVADFLGFKGEMADQCAEQVIHRLLIHILKLIESR